MCLRKLPHHKLKDSSTGRNLINHLGLLRRRNGRHSPQCPLEQLHHSSMPSISNSSGNNNKHSNNSIPRGRSQLLNPTRSIRRNNSHNSSSSRSNHPLRHLKMLDRLYLKYSLDHHGQQALHHHPSLGLSPRLLSHLHTDLFNRTSLRYSNRVRLLRRLHRSLLKAGSCSHPILKDGPKALYPLIRKDSASLQRFHLRRQYLRAASQQHRPMHLPDRLSLSI